MWYTKFSTGEGKTGPYLDAKKPTALWSASPATQILFAQMNPSGTASHFPLTKNALQNSSQLMLGSANQPDNLANQLHYLASINVGTYHAEYLNHSDIRYPVCSFLTVPKRFHTLRIQAAIAVTRGNFIDSL